MIYRTPERPILFEDLEVGSLVRVRTPEEKYEEYIVLSFYGQDEQHAFVEGFRIESVESKKACTHYLYADKVVLLNRMRKFSLQSIDMVQARLSKDIVNNIEKKFKKKQAEQEKRRAEQRKKNKVRKKKKAELLRKKQSAMKKAKVYRHPSSPKDSTNNAWEGLKYASEGYIHIFRG